MRRSPLILALVSLLLVVAGACNSAVERDGSEVRVVASTALIAEFASTVAGDDAIVVGLIPAGVDLHSFEPAPGLVAAIAQADLVLVNGHNLEEGLLEVIEQNVSDGVRIVAVSDGIERLLAGGHDEAEHDEADDNERDGVDPHLWLDVRNAIHYVEQTRDALIEVDSAREGGYEERAAAYMEELEALDAELVGWLSLIRGDARQLVVFHDAYGYLAAAYGLEVLAAVLPAGAQQDPAAGRVAELIELVRESGVRVVFAEPQFNSTVLDRIASEAGVQVRPLYSTFAGDVDSYIKLMRANGESLGAGAGIVR